MDRIALANPLGRFSLFSWGSGLKPSQQNLIHMALWILLFSWMYTTAFVGKDHPGRSTAFWVQACSDHKHNACNNLRAIYRDDCNDGDATTCIRLGTSIIDGRLIAADPLQGLRSFARACDLGNPTGCLNLIQQLTAENSSKLQKACLGKDASSCYILGSVNLIGLSGTVDRVAAFHYFEKACDLDSATGCGVMADAYRYGVGTEKNLQQAFAGYDKACHRSFAASCVSLADMLDEGQGTAKDVRRAKALYQKACQLGLHGACNR
jgi:TPR repeat protein